MVLILNLRKLHQKLSAWKNTAIGKPLLQNQRGYQSQSKLLNSNPSTNECESLNLFGSGILMTFKLSLSDLGNSDSFDNCYLPGKKFTPRFGNFCNLSSRRGPLGSSLEIAQTISVLNCVL